MRKRKNRHRILLVALCVMFVLGLACPAFAAEVSPYPGYIYAGTLELLERDFEFENGFYVASPFIPYGVNPAEAEACIVKYGAVVRRLEWGVYSGDSFPQSFFVGNPHLLDNSLADNGELFALGKFAEC